MIQSVHFRINTRFSLFCSFFVAAAISAERGGHETETAPPAAATRGPRPGLQFYRTSSLVSGPPRSDQCGRRVSSLRYPKIGLARYSLNAPIAMVTCTGSPVIVVKLVNQ